jgi:NAD(P)-dependent dehydrogenase (short-subunit alcohol dehydrogenase family)
MQDMFSVVDKAVLITGGNGGIGGQLVKGFDDAGACVGSVDLLLPKLLPTFADFFVADLSDPKQVEQVFEQFIEKLGGIDVLINCAGITCPQPGSLYDKAIWDRVLAVNLNAPFQLCQLAGKKMIEQGTGGSIINITSINAAVAMPNNPAYAAAKAGLRHMSKALALDWGKYNIRVNNLGPGYTETKMNRKSLSDPDLYQQRCDGNMLCRWAKPEEMVGPAIFLASDASSYVTGSDLWVDGGWISKGI